jgi:hypothetical protein
VITGNGCRFGTLQIGVNSVRRPSERGSGGYLRETITSLRARLDRDSSPRVRLLVINCDPDPAAHVAAMELAAEVEPSLRAEVLALGPSPIVGVRTGSSFARWQQQLCFDYARLLRRCRGSGADWILIAEDDLVASRGYNRALARWVLPRFVRQPDLFCVSLFSIDLTCDFSAYAPAIVYKNDDRIDALAGFLESRSAESPADWSIRDFAAAPRRRAFVQVPSLFQHIGAVSSSLVEHPLLQSPTFAADPVPLFRSVRLWPRDALIAGFRLRWHWRRWRGRQGPPNNVTNL